ncbi:DEAD/DEAH box helicase [Vibrio rumoiensis]|uniref:DEAD/DEAH box helicase n=1 Tax=Vibrio rumoiensis 1S-45 TaxID=1188252 RepID=A0A1E5DZH9_9VIBR|nr:DEAD/DEAH box helicase [Vibrio rumoiensis]OEF23273.1 DEAD/DEAH box helicase [Vibrio rumoiensis 1S-45]
MTFSELKICDDILRALPKSISTPTLIQEQAIPAIFHQADVLALAQTGSGKTLAYGLPILQMLKASKSQIQCVIIAPTRELARQIHQDLLPITSALTIKAASLFGGVDLSIQTSQLALSPQIIIATPGRLLALIEAGSVDLSTVKHLVLDEADRLLDMGFWSDIQNIISNLPINRQTLCFSATLTGNIEAEIEKVLVSPVRLNAHTKNSVVSDINEKLYLVNKGSKTNVLLSLLDQQADKQALIFTNAKDTADSLAKKLKKAGISLSVLHGNKDQADREQALCDFKNKKINILIATDLLARGIHIDNLPSVINFELPENPAVYVHRIGRTARAGQTGVSISLVCHAEQEVLTAIRDLTKQAMPLVELSDFPVTDKPSTGETKRQPRDKQANRRSAKKRSIKDFQSKSKPVQSKKRNTK